MTEKIGAWIGLISSAITVTLTVLNFSLNKEIEQMKLTVMQTETSLKEKAYELEQSKEKTERYEFVNKLMPGILEQNKAQVILTTNLISLALNEDEAKRLFTGFANSKEKVFRKLVKRALKVFSKKKVNSSKHLNMKGKDTRL